MPLGSFSFGCGLGISRPIVSSPLFSWNFLNFQNLCQTPLFSIGAPTYLNNGGTSGLNSILGLGYGSPIASGYQVLSLNIPSFFDFFKATYTPNTNWYNINTPASTGGSGGAVGRAPTGSSVQQSGSISCATQNIRSKNAPYNGYDRSPHRAVNSNVNNYTRHGNNKHIEQLEPEFQLKVMKIIDYAKQHGYDFKITSSFRTRSHQDRLRKKYANQKGRAAKVSPHMFGKAIDFQVLKNGRKCSAGYDLIGKYAESLGIRWGGRFKTCVERWHIDYNWV